MKSRSYGKICPESTHQNQRQLFVVYTVTALSLVIVLLLLLLTILSFVMKLQSLMNCSTKYTDTIFLQSSPRLFPQKNKSVIASHYDYGLKGHPNYSKENLTAASKDYPRKTKLKVCRADQAEKCVVVRVNDYGPEHCKDNPVACPERDIDLSSKAFKELAPLSKGLLQVTITKL